MKNKLNSQSIGQGIPCWCAAGWRPRGWITQLAIMKSKFDSMSLAALTAVLLFSLPLVASAQTLINGANQTGTITNKEVDSYTFTANAGDNINLRLGSTGFFGYLRLYGPDGALLTTAGANQYDQFIAYTATNSGTFTVLVSSWDSGGTGTYALHLAQMPEPFIVPAGDEGGAMTNGGDYSGNITIGDLDMYSFTANAGDSINLRLGTTGFFAYLELYGPNGALLSAAGANNYDRLIAYTATNSGTFTVLVSSWDSGGTGTYALHLAQMPEPFIVPAGDEGGPMTNGGDYSGNITIGDMDMWSFTANAGDSINLRLGSTGFFGYLELYGPNGALLSAAGGNEYDHLIAYTATNSGTFTALVSSWGNGGTGTYALHLAQMPEPFILPTGDEGGAMTGSAHYAGTITLSDMDIWAFTACTGDAINLTLNTTNFFAWLELYGPNGALLRSAGGNEYGQSITYTATNCGTFTVLVSSWGNGGTGTYGLTANGLSYELRECLPKISGANLTVNGVGGPTNAVFVLYTTTNVATPFGLWTPVLTNQFDQFGVFSYTNTYNPTQRQQFFRFVVP